MHISYVWKGVALAIVIIGAWAAALIVSLTLDLSLLPLSSLLLLSMAFILLNTFLYTGLFITAHDAMHGTVAPRHPKLNRLIGRIATLLYALFSYDKLERKHRLHHAHPASEADPDYHDGEHTGFFRWYLHFFFTYVTWKQLLGMAIIFNLLKYAAGIPDINILLFWVLPALLSTVQLFFFGTWLPHREPPDGYTEPHRAVSNDYNTLLSFLSCYHFGYHYEHHAAPGTPWWRLPDKRASLLSK